MISEIIVPKLGATGGDVMIEEWLVEPGTFVNAGAPLLTIVTDKATVELEAFRSGYLRAQLAQKGETVELGAVVGLIGDSMQEPLEAQVKSPKLKAKREKQNAASEDALTPAKEKPKQGRAGRQSRKGRLAAALSGELLVGMFRAMVMIRRFEDYLYQLFLQGLVPGTLHQYQGQEAVAVGVCSALRRDDWMFSTHRPVGHFLAKGSSARGIAAEIWGKATGCAGGKGGQMHLCDMAVGAPPSNAIVGANVPIATGAALAFQLRGQDRVAVSFFGDGASNIGAFHEGVNLAAVKNAPVIFVLENNQYAASTHISLTTKIEELAARANAYGIPGVQVDGMDISAVYAAARAAVERARGGEGPTLLECKTYRYMGHSRGDPGGYRTKSELQEWRAADPIESCRTLLVTQYGVEPQALTAIEAACQREVEDAVEFARSSPEPDARALAESVYAE